MSPPLPTSGQVQPDPRPANTSASMPATRPVGNGREEAAVELARVDFGEWDFDLITEAFYPVMAEVQDIQFHCMAGTEWTPYIERGKVPELIAECRAIIARLEAPIKIARRQIAILEGTARLRAHRRITNGPDLTGHTIIIETLDTATAREINRPDAAGQLAIVECHDGRRGKVCAIHDEIPPEMGIENAARSIASTYGARYAGMVK